MLTVIQWFIPNLGFLFYPVFRTCDYLLENYPGDSFPGEKGGDARLKFWIRPLKETDLGAAQAFLTAKRDHVIKKRSR